MAGKSIKVIDAGSWERRLCSDSNTKELTVFHDHSFYTTGLLLLCYYWNKYNVPDGRLGATRLISGPTIPFLFTIITINPSLWRGHQADRRSVSVQLGKEGQTACYRSAAALGRSACVPT
jgi:hypothetical protein